MSFLAQLQQQQHPSTTEQALKLHYVLSLENSARQLPQLVLNILVGEQDKLLEGKAYQPQSSHLQLPPPFIQNIDKPVLQQLLSGPLSKGWPEYAYDDPQHFFHKLFATERVLFQVANRLDKIELGPNQATELNWHSQPGGQQIFAPGKLDGKQLCQSANYFHVLALNSQQQPLTLQLCSLICTDQDFSNRQNALSDTQKSLIQERLAATDYTLSTEDIGHFVKAFGEVWQATGLPTPNEIDAIPLETQVRATLNCTHQQQEDTITQGYAYLHKDYCTWFTPDDEQPHYVVLDEQLHVIRRNPEAEAPFNPSIKKALKGFQQKNHEYNTTNDSQWQYFFVQEKRKLDKEGVIFRISERFTKHYIQADNWISQLYERSDGYLQVDLFVEANNQKINLLALLDQIQQYNLQRTEGDMTLKLESGRLLLLSSEQAVRLTEGFGDVIAASRQSFQFHPNQRSRLKQLADALPSECGWQGDTSYLEASRKLAGTPQVIDQATCNVQATLRPYQWLGVCWIQHLKNCQVNGLLADDMGLGKTLQTISHLSLEFAQTPKMKPALVIVPTSLLHNWYNEIKKFASHLRVMIYHGPQRKKKLQTSDHHILLTSYQLIVNDANYFEQTEFSWMVLDEAQNIKNPRTKSHNSVKSVNATHRLCLSGTPVENNLVELWALLNFLMPQCLGSLSDFKFHYQRPIENEGNVDKLNQLLKRIEPFMLRRTKQAVADDLPKKTEIKQIVDLSEAQYSFYESIKLNTWQELQDNLKGTKNQGEQQLFVLSALMKLRQACCDPALLGATGIPSAKRQQCISMASELAAEGRAILIFSQFTSMLDILADDLKKQGINYGLLTGKTRNRQTLVDKFQSGEFPVFLISLKAGGVGLNLTRADTVIHYDPWWNSAAEQQATDRAHRIGQKNAVFVYKLIAENTIEEKIAALQAKKAELGQTINLQAQQTGAKFSMKLEELLNLWVEE